MATWIATHKAKQAIEATFREYDASVASNAPIPIQHLLRYLKERFGAPFSRTALSHYLAGRSE